MNSNLFENHNVVSQFQMLIFPNFLQNVIFDPLRIIFFINKVLQKSLIT